jgi:CHAT domain
MALARGARADVASLRPVPDRTTSELMGQFYSQLLDHNRPADDSLAIAMRRIVASGLTDPALWPAFTSRSLLSEIDTSHDLFLVTLDEIAVGRCSGGRPLSRKAYEPNILPRETD